MTGERGLVLLNALVLVAAMAAAAVLVLRQSETHRANLFVAQEADQLVAYLDAFEAHAMVVLARDSAQVDHPGDAWAGPAVPFDLDRGQVRGEIVDLQSRFNVNWLANPNDREAQDSFDALLSQIGGRSDIARVFENTFRSDPSAGSRFALLDPPAQAVAGPRVMMAQLARIPDLSPRDHAVLDPYVTVLPGDSTLNVNTASETVIIGFFPSAKPAQVRGVLAKRLSQPFASVDDFLSAIEIAQGAGLGDGFDRGRFSVNSRWFGVSIEATLNQRTAVRTLVLERRGTGDKPRVHWRITELN
ncbi:MAG: type II secretion system minor pseudopilin GspK [Pseudomonadota bacterium]